MAERLNTDVLVVGAGPAGIAAAVTAAAHGRQVLLVDEGMRPGGQIWRHIRPATLPSGARRWIDRLHASPVVQMFGAAVTDLNAERQALLEVNGRARVVEAAEAVILCTGARERFLPFPGWTLPGVVGVGGAQALLKSGATVTGLRVVVAGSGPLLLPVAAALAGAGARVRLVAEQAPARAVRRFGLGLWRTPGRLLDAARYRAAFAAAPYRLDCWVTAAHGADRVEAARVRRGNGAPEQSIECDLLCVGYGLVPALELPRLAGCAIAGGQVRVDAAQRTSVAGLLCAGEPTGVAGADAALTQGEIAGLTAVGAAAPEHMRARRATQLRFAAALESTFALRGELRELSRPDTIVCRCEDVRLGALQPFSSTREAKLIARAGMGPCQGRVCGPALQFLFDWEPDAVRPPVTPALVGTLADAGFSETHQQP